MDTKKKAIMEAARDALALCAERFLTLQTRLEDERTAYGVTVWAREARAASAALEAALSAPETGAGVPEGWRLVPVEPTREMLKAAGDLENETAVKNYGGSPTADDYWSAMLSAAPTPPQAGGDQGALHDPGPDWVKMPWTNRYIPSSPDKGGSND